MKRLIAIACIALTAAAALAAEQGAPQDARRPRPPAQTQKIRRIDNVSRELERAQRYMRDERWNEAIVLLEAVHRDYPQIVVATELLADCYLKAGRPREAAVLLEREVAANPEDWNYLRTLGLAYVDLGERDRAIAAWNRMLGGDQEQAAFYGAVARLEQEAGYYDEAVATLRAGRRHRELAAQYTNEIIRILLLSGRTAEVRGEALELFKTLRSESDFGQARFAIDAFRATGIEDRLIPSIDSLIAIGGERNTFLPFLRAILLIESGRYDDARRYLFENGAAQPDEHGLYSLVMYLKGVSAARREPAYDAFQRDVMKIFLDRFAGSALAPSVMLASAAIARRAAPSGGPAREAALREAIALADGAARHRQGGPYIEQAALFGAEILLDDLGSPHEALEALGGVSDRSPARSAGAEELRARALISLGDWGGAAERLGSLMKGQDTTLAVFGRFGLGRIAFLRGEYEAAVDTFSRLAAAHPESEWANDALETAMLIKENMGEWAPALDLYRAALLARGRGDSRSALDSLAAIDARFPYAPIAPRALLERGDILAAAGRTEEARAAYEALSETHPLSELAPVALERTAAIAEASGAADAASLYARVLERYPEYPFLARVRERYIELGKAAGSGPAPKGGPR